MKKLISALLSAALLLAASTSVFAAELPGAETAYYELNSSSTQEISPRMNYLTSVFTDLTFIDGVAYCQGNYTIFKEYKVTLTLTIQRSSINTTSEYYWSSVPDASWSQSWTTKGAHAIERSKSGLPTGYYYRTRTIATVYSSTGAMLESIVVKSVASYH